MIPKPDGGDESRHDGQQSGDVDAPWGNALVAVFMMSFVAETLEDVLEVVRYQI